MAIHGPRKMEIPFNFGKDIGGRKKDMTVEDENKNRREEENNNDELEEEEEEGTYIDAETNKKRVFIRDPTFNYEYIEFSGKIFRVRVEFFVRGSRLSIIDKVLSLKYHGSMENFIETAIINQIEADLYSPQTIAEELVKGLLKRWEPYSGPEKKSLQNATSDY